MAAALAASEYENVQVILMERQARVGRKLSATGNGRCNLSNLHADEQGYHGDDVSFSKGALEQYPVQQTLHWFSDMGLLTVTEASGRVYPYSDQANSVVDVLRYALEKPNIQLLTGFEVSKARRADSGFLVESADRTISCDKLIIACGGLAGSKLGGSMSGYKLLSRFGHRSTRLRPALVQVKADWSGISALKGVRANCQVSIMKDGQRFSASTGEIQFTEYGLSGPVIFEVSRDVCQGNGQWTSRLDFLPDLQDEQLMAMLHKRLKASIPAEEILTGILHNRLGRVLAKAAGIRSGVAVHILSEDDLHSLCDKVKNFEIPLLEPLGMDSAQVTAGGVITDGFDPMTMESKLVPGLYACGEVLDVDGDCGGYNLQWAWSSGRCAGHHAGKES